MTTYRERGPVAHAAVMFASFLPLLLIGTAVLVTIVAAIVAGIARWGTLERSAWEQVAQAPRWFALFIGVSLITDFLHLYVGRGHTRREFTRQSAVFAVFFTAVLAAFITVGYAVEGVVYDIGDWPQELERSHLFGTLSEHPVILLEYWLVFLTWMVVGSLVAAGFYRGEGEWGIATLALGLGLVGLVEATVSDGGLPFLDRLFDAVGRPPAVVAVLVGVSCVAAGMAAAWGLLRDVPLRSRNA